MITSGEIQRLARLQGVRDTQIEKDYVIGWILKGISRDVYLAESLIFKGGTVLKKVWFEDYRFSEDMDFTAKTDHWDPAKLEIGLNRLCDWVYKESRIHLTIQTEGETSAHAQYKCSFHYQGPLGGEKTLKCDISSDEKICFDPVQKTIFDAYSDAEGTYPLQAYALEEALAEKVRCLLQRTIPRDLYDVWYLTEISGIDIKEIAFAFQEKAVHKGLSPKTIFHVLEAKKGKYQANWEKSLQHQIGELPEFEEVWRGLMRNVKKMILLLND
ncbi:MAG: nucleotidyl transferase AbiEii/AbiGii toxin family protein [Bacteroidia bacterium]|nr:nucleotidyl transferase AbiEii/AbiGii toxin family protein [Bacteroidia bacterium]